MRDKGHEAQGWEGVFSRKKSSFSHNPIGKDSGVKGPLCTCMIRRAYWPVGGQYGWLVSLGLFSWTLSLFIPI